MGMVLNTPGDSPALHEYIGAESGQALYTEGEVKLVFLFKLWFLGVGENAVSRACLVSTGSGPACPGYQLSVYPHLGRGVWW